MPILEKETSVFPADLFTAPQWEPGTGARRWWAVYTKARHEKAIARELLRFEVPFFLPLVVRENWIRRRVVKSRVPLFPGYVFLYGSEDERARSLTTNRISKVLPVPEQTQLRTDLRQLQHLIETDAPLTVERRLEPGQPVRIKSGPMRGLDGVVTHRRGGRRRLLIAVRFLQSGVSVEIDDFMVEPA